MTDDELTTIAQRWQAVPPGPWVSTYRYRLVHRHDWLLTSEDGRRLIFAADINLHENPWAAPDATVQLAIAAAPEDIAVLLAEIHRLRRALDGVDS